MILSLTQRTNISRVRKNSTGIKMPALIWLAAVGSPAELGVAHTLSSEEIALKNTGFMWEIKLQTYLRYLCLKCPFEKNQILRRDLDKYAV